MNVGPEQPRRWWLYLRVSNDPTGRGLSVADQERELRAWVEREGGVVVGVTTDNDRSASRNSKARPGYKEIHRQMAAGAMDVLGCWESSRAQRDVRAYIDTRDLCEQQNILFAYKSRIYDLSRSGDRFSTVLDAALDERYADEIKERVERGVQSSLRRGSPRGKIPFGYKRIYDRATGAMVEQVPDPETAPIVRELFARLAAEEPVYRIAKDFNRRGLITPQAHRDTRRGVQAERGGWTSSKIRRQAMNPNVAGFRVHQKKIQGPTGWEALVPADVYNRAQRYLSDPTRRKQRGVAPAHLLSGILQCGVCQARCRRIINRGRESYSCQGHDYTNPSCVSGTLSVIDGFVVQYVVKELARPDFLSAFTVDEDPRVAEAAGELAALEARLETFRQAAEHQGLSAESLIRMERTLLPQIAEARERATPKWVSCSVRDLLNAPDPVAHWEQMTLLPRRDTLADLLQVTLHKDVRPRGSRGFDTSRIELKWRWITDNGAAAE